MIRRGKKNLPRNYPRFPRRSSGRKSGRRSERGPRGGQEASERTGGRGGKERREVGSRPKSERRENLARRSVGGRKEVPVRGPPLASFCVSLIPRPPPPRVLRRLIFFICEGIGARGRAARLCRAARWKTIEPDRSRNFERANFREQETRLLDSELPIRESSASRLRSSSISAPFELRLEEEPEGRRRRAKVQRRTFEDRTCLGREKPA